MLQPFIEATRAEIEELCRTHHVERLAIFGSAVRDDFDPERSDVDVRVLIDEADLTRYVEDLHALHAGLASLLRCRVDLVSNRTVRNRILREEIAATQALLYAA